VFVLPKTLSSVKEEVASYKGKRVRCRVSKGRNRVEIIEGTILEIYPKLFTVSALPENSLVSFNYAEVLTREVIIEVLD